MHDIQTVGKLGIIIFAAGMPVDVDHDAVRRAAVSLRPERTVADTANDAFRHADHPRYQVAPRGSAVCLPYFCPCILRLIIYSLS